MAPPGRVTASVRANRIIFMCVALVHTYQHFAGTPRPIRIWCSRPWPTTIDHRQRPANTHALTEPAFEPETNCLGLAIGREKDMYVIRTTSRLDELPSASAANFFDSPLYKNALIRGEENRLVFHPFNRHPLPGFVVSDKRLTVRLPTPVHRTSQIAMEARTVCSERDVIRQR